MSKRKHMMADCIFTMVILLGVFALNLLLQNQFRTQTMTPMIFVLGVFLVSWRTQGYLWGIAASLISVLAVNWAFTYPYWAFDLISPECISSALVMLIVSAMTGTLTTRLKQQEKLKADAEKERMRGNLLRAVSHDLRTPLTSIYGACSAMIENYDELPKEKQLKLLGDIRGDAQWLNRMVENLLSVTRVDADKVRLSKPGMFFMVELGAVLSACIVYFTFRKEKGAIPKSGKMTEVNDIVPTVLLVGAIVLLIVASFLPFELPAETNGLICTALLIVGLIYNYATKKNLDAITGPLKAIDLETLGLLVGLFLMIGGISNMGVIDALAQLLAKLGAGNPFLMYTIIVWASVLISAFIDNIPYVATMIPVIAGIAAEMGIDSTALYFGLLSGATLGGNCTPIGASANIAGIGILRKEGYDVKNGDFFKIGIPFTLSAIVPAYILIWILFGM